MLKTAYNCDGQKLRLKINSAEVVDGSCFDKSVVDQGLKHLKYNSKLASFQFENIITQLKVNYRGI